MARVRSRLSGFDDDGPSAARGVLCALLHGMASLEERATFLPEAFVPPGLEVKEPRHLPYIISFRKIIGTRWAQRVHPRGCVAWWAGREGWEGSYVRWEGARWLWREVRGAWPWPCRTVGVAQLLVLLVTVQM
jgi:hypothetical protein